MLKGINVEIIKELIGKTDIPIIYSGGITTLEDIKTLKELGIYGVVIGSALYKGLINLKDAVKIAKS